MIKDLPGEKWKVVDPGFKYSNESRLEVSNMGRLRTFNKANYNKGRIMKGSLINGYKIIRMKFHKARSAENKKKFEEMEAKASKLLSKIYQLKRALKAIKKKDPAYAATKAKIESVTEQHKKLRAQLSALYKADEKSRTIRFQPLVHRLVAQYWLKKPTAKQTIVGHLNHDKLDNRAENLKWMTHEENVAHQRNSPAVIKEKQNRRLRRSAAPGVKLNVSKVAQIKKLLNNQTPIKKIALKYGVTDTQIIRIKRGENWGDVVAAK